MRTSDLPPTLIPRKSATYLIGGILYARPVENALLAWHAENGADLPWRRRRDPYAVLVSEVMLQQTQVARVVTRFQAWMERWPTIEAFAAAGLEEVIRAWQGLGYNRRAVNLHRAGRIVAAHGWPEVLTELPGVGSYTAAAIRRFAWGEAVLPLDTNVQRVIERSGGDFGPAASEALMDLGREVCLARVPRCGICPLAAACPSRGQRFEPLRKQSRFEGSFRQRRAETLRLVAAGKTTGLDAEAIASLQRDGLVETRSGLARLPQ
jgi:A/G-specific adenine glycosylase